MEQFLGLVEFGELDYLVIDLPAGTGSETVNCLRLLPDIDGAVVVTTPSYLACSVGLRAVDLLRKAGVPVLGVVENMAGVLCPACGKEYQLLALPGASLAEQAGLPCLASVLLEEEVAASGDAGMPLATKDGSRAGTFFMSLASKVAEILTSGHG